MMITFPYIEDYLEVLGGYRPITSHGRSPGPATLFALNGGPISLARYDVNIVASMAGHTANNGSLTDRQSELVLKIIAKYRRQFKNNGVDVEPSLANPQFRNAIRVIDRSRHFAIKNNKIVARFPYDKTLIGFFSAAAKENRGSCQFDRDQKEWILGFTTYNVNWAVSIAKEYQFTVEDQLATLMQSIVDCETAGHEIDLVHDDQLRIRNAAPSLINYINQKLGGFDPANLVRLIDHSAILGYQVSEPILQQLNAVYDPVTVGLLLDRQIHYPRNDHSAVEFLSDIRRYMEMSGRGPVYVYEPDASDKLKTAARSVFAESEIVDVSTAKTTNYLDNPEIKLVYFSKIKKSMSNPIPLLISTNAMLYGVDKQYMLQLAEKVVYFTTTTLNKEAKTIAS